MHIARILIASLLLAGTAPLMAQQAPSTTPPQAIATPLMTKPVPQHPGEELLLLSVEYPPGAVDPVHRHHASGMVYVLEGSIVMGVRGSEPVTLKAGDVFYEGPDDVHEIGRNASATEPARFLAFFLKKVGAPVLVPAE